MAEQKIAPEFALFEMELDQPFFVLSETEPYTKITGELKFELRKPLPKTEKLVFRFLGGVVARHDDSRNNSKLRGLRRLFDKELILWEPNVDRPEIDPTDEQDPRSPAIVGRVRTLCFSVKVPSTTPPSASWKRGHIQYLLVASFFHEPACISCCGGLRIPFFGYREPDIIKKEIVIRRASPGLLTSLPAYSELSTSKPEDGEAEKAEAKLEDSNEERKIEDRLFRKSRENVLRWRPLKDVEIVIPAVIHNNEEQAHVLVEVGKHPALLSTDESGVDQVGEGIVLQSFSWSLKQIEKYELTHLIQPYDDPAPMERKVVVDRDNELTLPNEVSLVGVFPPIEDGVASVAFDFRSVDEAAELEPREVEPVDDLEASNVINVTHAAALVLKYKILSTSDEGTVSIDAPVVLHTPFDAAQLQRDIEKIQADRALRDEFERSRAANTGGVSNDTTAVTEATDGEVRQRTAYAAEGADE